jgi:hypothetical protein
LVDSAGQPVEGARIAGVWFGSGGETQATNAAHILLNGVSIGTSARITGTPAATYTTATATFSPDGQTVTVMGIVESVTDLNVRFSVIAAPGFEGTLYVLVDGPLVNRYLSNNIAPIANTRPDAAITVDSVVVPVGTATVDLNPITITLRRGDLADGQEIQLELDQRFGFAGQLAFAPMNATQRRAALSVTGEMNAEITDITDNILTIYLSGGTGSAEASVTISGLQVSNPFLQPLPRGLYGLAVHGELVNAAYAGRINVTYPAGTRYAATNVGFRRWATDALIIDGVIDVGGDVGGVPVQGPTTIVVPFSGSTVNVNGEIQVLRDYAGNPIAIDNRVIDGTARISLPLRAVTTLFGGIADPLGHTGPNGAFQAMTFIPGAPNEVVIWTLESNSVTIENVTGRTTMTITVAPFLIGNSTMVPLRSFSDAHGIEITHIGDINATFTLHP